MCSVARVLCTLCTCDEYAWQCFQNEVTMHFWCWRPHLWEPSEYRCSGCTGYASSLHVCWFLFLGGWYPHCIFNFYCELRSSRWKSNMQRWSHPRRDWSKLGWQMRTCPSCCDLKSLFSFGQNCPKDLLGSTWSIPLNHAAGRVI